MSENEIPVVKLVRAEPLKPEPIVSYPWQVWTRNAQGEYGNVTATHTKEYAIACLSDRPGFVVNVEAAVRDAMPKRKVLKLDRRLYVDANGCAWYDRSISVCPCIAILDLSGIEIEVPE